MIGAGQSALEAAALLREAGAQPHLWYERIRFSGNIASRSNVVSGVDCARPFRGSALGQKPGGLQIFRERCTGCPLHGEPASSRIICRPRVHGGFAIEWKTGCPIHFGTTVIEAREAAGRVALQLRHAKDGSEGQLMVDHVIAGSGYDIDVERLGFIDQRLRCAIQRLERAPKLNANFETSVSGLHFIGPASAMSFGPLFRFVVGAEYTARVVSAHLAARTLSVA